MELTKTCVQVLAAVCFLTSSQSEETTAKKSISVLLLNAIFPGHLFPLISLGEELVKRGHNVTLCAPVLEGSTLLPALPESVGVQFMNIGSDLSWKGYMETMAELQAFNPSTMNKVMLYNQLAATRIRSKLDTGIVDQFDIIVCDYSVLVVGVYYAELGKRVIVLSSFLPFLPPIQPSWPFPVTVTGSQTDNMGFFGRLFSPITATLLPKLFGKANNLLYDQDPRFREVLRGVDVIHYPGVQAPYIVTSVLALDVPILLTPQLHYVGPVLRSSHPPLDDELAAWLDGKQERSVLYISMGTTGDISKPQAEIIVAAVLGTKYSAIWALREDSMDSLEGLDIDDERFLIRTWLPQQAVLQHRAIKACLLHCGLNSVQESLYNGLPVVCVPHVFDQFQIGSAIERNKVGVSLYTFFDVLRGRKNYSLEVMADAFQKVTSDKYADNARRVSAIFKFAGGAKAAADLVEYYEEVGYDHLIPAYIKYQWTWVQYYNVDVYALLLCVTVLLLLGLSKCCSCICRRKCKRKVD